MNDLTHLLDFLRTPYAPCKTYNCTGIIATGVNHAKSFKQGTRKEEMLSVISPFKVREKISFATATPW